MYLIENQSRWRNVSLPAIACVSLCLAACGSGGGSGENTRLSEAPQPPAFSVSVKELGPIETNCDIRMRDGGYSARINEKSVWVYGDTFLTFPNEDNQRLLANSRSSTLDEDAGDGLYGFEENLDAVGAPLQFIPFTEDEIAFNEAHHGEACSEEPCETRWAIWPGTIIVDEEKGLAYIFYGKFHAGKGEFNFECKGRSIAVWKTREDNAPERIVFNEVENFPTLLFSHDEPRFGSAAVVVDQLAYIYGCSLDRSSMTKPCHLARVPIESILDKDKWSYYRSDGSWSSQMEDLSPVFNGNNMMSVFYNAYLDSYVAIYTEPLENHIMVRVAPRPEGPWSRPRVVWTSEEPRPSGWIYDALAHPEYSHLDDRLIYVTHSLKTGEFTSEMRLLELELTLDP